MRGIILYRPRSEYARITEEYVRDFEKRTGKALELIDVDTVEGSHLAELYGIVMYPAILAVANDGHLLQFWSGERFPLMNEVDAYLYQQ